LVAEVKGSKKAKRKIGSRKKMAASTHGPAATQLGEMCQPRCPACSDAMKRSKGNGNIKKHKTLKKEKKKGGKSPQKNDAARKGALGGSPGNGLLPRWKKVRDKGRRNADRLRKRKLLGGQNKGRSKTLSELREKIRGETTRANGEQKGKKRKKSYLRGEHRG